MMYRLFFLLLLLPDLVTAQIISCDSVRSLPLGSNVTIKGVVTSGSEFGTIRYIQDQTGGIALFSTSLTNVQRGDSIQVSGTSINYFNLLELNPISSHTVFSSGNQMPLAQVIDPNLLNETTESELVQINNVLFASGGQLFQSNTAYAFISNGHQGQIYIRSSNPLVGKMIPAGLCSIRGICTQFNNDFQLLPRDSNDILNTSSLFFSTLPKESFITQSGFTVNWSTNLNCTSEFRYGLTSLLELGSIPAGTNSTFHSLNISGANASQLYYGQAVAYISNDTIFSPLRAYITASNSSGQFKAYFNLPVEHNVAIAGNLAYNIGQSIDDTIIAYINRAKYSIDIAIYNFDQSGISSIASALNNAYQNGKQVRIIYEGGNSNAGVALLNSSIPRLASPTNIGYGIMHNKFMIIDAFSINPNDSWVLTGSTNWTSGQINTDANNCLFIQDQSVALAYSLEFEEMWGSNGALPNSTNAKFGPYKLDNTPHLFNVNGKQVELYFSPSDNANEAIANSVNNADFELQAAVLVITRQDLANEIALRAMAGVQSHVLVNDTGSGGIPFQIMQAALSSNIMIDNQAGIMHHKFLIVDQGFPFADPLILTGSHNWSNSAEQLNDENSILVFDLLLANQYYQAFVKLNNLNGGSLSINDLGITQSISAYPQPFSDQLILKGIRKHAHITIFSLDGRRVLDTSINPSEELITIINTSKIIAGLYLIQIIQDSSIVSFKIVKQ
ncbi:MAG TPA: phospholipase D-like domain-containing protein [Bacteroidia bacterium]|nr:phospholipase D-like domain-containing protein [Bacteroidia bacterium]